MRRAALHATRASVHASIGNGRSAIEDLESAFAIEPATYADALFDRLESERNRATESGDRRRVRDLQAREAHVLQAAGRVDEARATLLALLRDDAEDRAVLAGLADLEEGAGRWDAASAALGTLAELSEGEGTVDVALRLADACEHAGHAVNARAPLERALAEGASSPRAGALRARLAMLLERTGDFGDLATLVLEDAQATSDPGERFALLVRAGSLWLERAGDAPAAAGALVEARRLRPMDAICTGLLADAHMLAGDAASAQGLLEQAVLAYKGRRARELAPLYWRLARAGRDVGDATGELRAMMHALDCDPQNGKVCGDVALRAMELNEIDLASRALRAVTLLRGPGHAAGPIGKGLAYQHLGEIAIRQGDMRRALGLVKRALVEDPTLDGARALVGTIEQSLQAEAL